MANRRASERQAANSKSAGVSFRRVRSPDAPKITMAQGSAAVTELRGSRSSLSAMSVEAGGIRLSSYKRRPHATLRQGGAQLFGRPEENRAHAQGLGRFEVRGTVIYKNAFLGSTLRHSQRKPVDERIGLAHSQIAGSKKGGKVPGQIEFADAIGIQLFGLVVEGGQEIAAGRGQLVEQNARFFVLTRLREDEVLELI